jgi:aminoglycoside 6'-N-acetyltransferase
VSHERPVTGLRYSFRDATEADLPMLARWLATPEVSAWWVDPGAQIKLIRADLSDPGMATWIVELGGRPFAYAQHYEVHTWPQPHLASLPFGTRAVDLFVGETDFRGQGHGSRFLRLLASRLLAEGAPLVVIDPDARNVRARNAFQRAGFQLHSVVTSDDMDVALMIFQARSASMPEK